MPEGFDLQAFIEQGAKILAIFIFLVLPVIRSIREARRQAAEKQARGSAPQASEPEETPELDGRKAWEELLRGETVEVAPPPVPPPIPQPRLVGESRVPKPVPLFDLEQHAPKMASADNLELERRSDEEGVAQAEITRREREAVVSEGEGARFEREAEQFEEDFARRQRTATSALNVEPGTTERTHLPTAAAFHPAAVRRKRWARRAEVRAAFVASEVLGAPLALRRESHLPH
ncbi:MAG: hypothetical protein ACKVWV_13145 [Planctomycetota bacterium]